MLAQVHQLTTADAIKIVIWSFVLIGLLIVAFAAVSRIKRRLRDEVDNNPSAAAGFTLADLRQMHRNGVMTDDEFEKAKARIVQSATRKVAIVPEASPNGDGVDRPADENSLEFLDEPPSENPDAPST